MKLKLLIAISIGLLINTVASAVTEKTYDLPDLNIDIVVSVEGMPPLDLEYMKSIVGTSATDPKRFPHFNVTPLEVLHGSVLKLKIEAIDKAGIKTDVTNDKNTKINVAGSYVAHLCKPTQVCVWPAKPNDASERDQRFGTASVGVLYFTPGGKSIGQNVFRIKVAPDPSGRSINPPLVDTKPKPSTLKTQPITEQTWQQIKKLKGIATQSGMVTPSLYVFFDPNCPYCTDLWKTVLPVKPREEARKAEFFSSVPAIWIPVSYINDTSLGKSAALLRANSQSAIDNNFQMAKRKEKQGGVVAVVPTEKEKAVLAQAKALWLELGGATPLMVYRNKTGSTQLFMGVPSDDQLTELLGLIGASTLSTYSAK
jgi:thiol:disulfide interchange protein DsbG